MFESDFFHYYGAYTDELKEFRKLRRRPLDETIHAATCPICHRKRVNIYLVKEVGKYACKKCIDANVAELHEVKQ